MAVNQIQKDIPWGGYGVDIPELQNYTNSSLVTEDFDVTGNMIKIIQAGDSSTYPAAYAALNYAPFVAPSTKGKWALPTAGILYQLYVKLATINDTILALGGDTTYG